MSLLKEQVLKTLQEEFSKPPPVYNTSSLHKKEYAILQKEVYEFSPFDPLNVRHSMFIRAFHERSAPIYTYESSVGRIVALLDSEEQHKEVPWDLWFRILRAFHRHHSFTIFFLGNTHLRKFPKKGFAIQPQNINGGYTYPCKHDYICIYRAEDATRVLIHELFHASCSDSHEDGVDITEAKTEAWAELFYCGFLSGGDSKDFEKEIKRQSAWIVGQDKQVRKHMLSGGEDMKEFPWRYTIGKELLWDQWGILDRNVKPANVSGSLRLTVPPTAEQKRRLGVSQESNIL